MTNTIPNVPRELLERAAYTLELAYEVDTPTVRDIRALLSAPSPAGVDGLEVVAYRKPYMSSTDFMPHEPWCNDGISSEWEPLCRLSDAQAIIDGLRGRLSSCSAEKNDAIAYKAALERQDELRAELASTKAQGVVIPAELDRAFITGESCDGVYRVVIQSEKLKEMQAVHSWLTSLNAAPAAPAADGWIPVSERLPAVESRLDQECRAGTLSIAPLNVSAAVLVFDGEKVRSKRLDWFDGCLPLPHCVTHWMPLPAAPAANSAKGVV